jgi:hypothetical protein
VPACAGTESGATKAALLALLRPGGALAKAKSVLAYATFQAQADDVARFLAAHGVAAAAYHAGKAAKACISQPRMQSLYGDCGCQAVLSQEHGGEYACRACKYIVQYLPV